MADSRRWHPFSSPHRDSDSRRRLDTGEQDAVSSPPRLSPALYIVVFVVPFARKIAQIYL